MASSDFVMDLFCWWKSNVGYKKKGDLAYADEIERTLYHNGTVSSCLDG